MVIGIGIYEWAPNRYELVNNNPLDSAEELLLEHCLDTLLSTKSSPRVNDSEMNRRLLTRLLQAHGVDAIQFSNIR